MSADDWTTAFLEYWFDKEPDETLSEAMERRANEPNGMIAALERAYGRCRCHPSSRCGRCDDSSQGGARGPVGVTVKGESDPAKVDASGMQLATAMRSTPSMGSTPIPDTKPRCPKCKSPDLVPYKFGDIHDDVAAEYRARFPRARLCLDCLYCEWQPESE